jgi:hypothetical protein
MRAHCPSPHMSLQAGRWAAGLGCWVGTLAWGATASWKWRWSCPTAPWSLPTRVSRSLILAPGGRPCGVVGVARWK